MSTDVNYYSFNPLRANKHWPHFIEDFSVLRKKHSIWDKDEEDIQKFRKERDEIEDSFKPKINKITKEIFDFFDKKGYIIPWIEWDAEYGEDKYGNQLYMGDEEKMKYLKVYGCVYPRGSDLKNKETPYLMLKMDAPELEEAYDQIIDERDKAITQPIRKDVFTLKDGIIVELNKRQKELDKNTDLSYLKYDNVFDNNQLISDLKNLDIYFGSVESDYFENPNLEHVYLEVIIETYNLKTENYIPTREEWIRVFQNITNEKIEEAGNRLLYETDGDKDEAEWVIKDYLRSVRPVIKDLKENPGSIFIRSYGGEIEVEPKGAEAILLERAQKHATKYKGQLPPVL